MQAHCRASYRVRLGTNPLIVIMATQYSHSQKEHTELYKTTKFGVNRINFERLTTVQNAKIYKEMYGFPDKLSNPYISL